jgi:transcriptional regulator with XRE-family HTH domain
MEGTYDTYSITMTGEELRQARERLDMTQAELAEALGMWRHSVARMERSESPVMKHTELAIKYLLLTHGTEKSQRKETYGKKKKVH